MRLETRRGLKDSSLESPARREACIFKRIEGLVAPRVSALDSPSFIGNERAALRGVMDFSPANSPPINSLWRPASQEERRATGRTRRKTIVIPLPPSSPLRLACVPDADPFAAISNPFLSHLTPRRSPAVPPFPADNCKVESQLRRPSRPSVGPPAAGIKQFPPRRPVPPLCLDNGRALRNVVPRDDASAEKREAAARRA